MEGGTLRQLDAFRPRQTTGRSRGAGCDWVHVAIDDVTRHTYVGLVADEQQPTAIGVLSRSGAWFNGGVECRKVVIDNDSA